MKKLTLAVACSSLLLSPLAFSASDAGSLEQEATGTTYVTGNIKANTERNTETTLEIGHTFTTGTTILVEIAGELKHDVRTVTDTTFGIEQSFNFTENFWGAVGYHDLSLDGSAYDGANKAQRRPLIKIGYNFDNGISIANRTRAHYMVNDNENFWGEVRYDTNITYTLDNGLQLKANWVYNQRDMADADKGQNDRSSSNYEYRITQNNFMDTGVAPYFELRDEDMGDNEDRNLAFTFGASYAF